jgi:uncharacterized damage-inducible protein DinB
MAAHNQEALLMKLTLSALCLFLFVAGTIPVAAQLQQVHPFRDGTPGVTGYRSEVLALVMIQENEFLRLAEAFPAEKYTWRPGPGVKSVAEVFLHVAAANYNMYKLIGAPVPAGLDIAGMEQSTTDKATIIAMLKTSYAHAKQAITDMPDANLEKTMPWLGGTITQRGILLYIIPHIAEHLGQAIAYARVNGVVPPWSEDSPNKK